jgi:hypothetical protein
MCNTVQGKGWACGNAEHVLHALGGSAVSVEHGRGGVHGGAWSSLARGIDPLGRDGAGGEETGQEVVGAALPKLGAHGAMAMVAGAGGVGLVSLCSVGSS